MISNDAVARQLHHGPNGVVMPRSRPAWAEPALPRSSPRTTKDASTQRCFLHRHTRTPHGQRQGAPKARTLTWAALALPRHMASGGGVTQRLVGAALALPCHVASGGGSGGDIELRPAALALCCYLAAALITLHLAGAVPELRCHVAALVTLRQAAAARRLPSSASASGWGSSDSTWTHLSGQV